jgi:hypothetical protein
MTRKFMETSLGGKMAEWLASPAATRYRAVAYD